MAIEKMMFYGIRFRFDGDEQAYLRHRQRQLFIHRKLCILDYGNLNWCSFVQPVPRAMNGEKPVPSKLLWSREKLSAFMIVHSGAGGNESRDIEIPAKNGAVHIPV